jgi:Mg-chelatase subunit ChlD
MIAVLISIVAHGVFFAASRHITLPGAGGIGDKARKIFRIKEIDKTPETMVLFRETEKTTVFPDREESEPLIETAFLDTASAVIVEQEDLAFEKKKEQEDPGEEIEDIGSAKKPVVAEELPRATENLIKEKRAPASRDISGVVLSRGPSSLSSAPKIHFDETEYRETDPLRGDAGESGSLGDSKKDSLEPGGDIVSEKALERVGKYEDMTSYLEVSLKTYRNPDTGENFFSAQITVRDGVKIEPMPKEMIFLVDTSKSITESRFEHVKSGLSEVLRSLDEKDTFNIIAFKQEQEQFAVTSRKATDENVRAGRAFISALSADGQTNIENALLRIVQCPLRTKPSYVVLVSDGRPTTGMTSAREIIKAITRTNMGKRPVFSFGVGLRVNEYLLDFISYQNRAWSELARSGDTPARDLLKLYRDISSPILTHIRYRVSGIGSEEIFPKELPDFYHSKGLTVYGKYWDEDVFSMQVLGEKQGNIKEFIFKRRFSEAEKGSREIEKNWAFSKIYYKIGLDTMGKADPKTMIEEVSALSLKYGIDLPLLEEAAPGAWDEE